MFSLQKKLCLLVFVIALCFNARAQAINPTDSLDWANKNQEAEGYYKQGNYEKAIASAKQAVQKSIAVFGKQHPNYLLSISNLSNSYKKNGQFKEAEPYSKEIVNINKQLYGKEHSKYLASIRNLAILYMNMYVYEEAEPLYLEISSTIKKLYGTENNTYASSLYDLAYMYDEMLEYAKAKPYYEECLAIRKKTLKPEHDDYLLVLNDLAALCSTMGFYAQAVTYHIESLAIRQKKYGKISAAYALSASNLGVVYMKMNNYAEAEIYLKEALDIRKQVFGMEHKSYASSLYNLGSLFLNTGRYKLAENLYKESVLVYKRALGPNSADYAMAINMLANLYVQLANYDEAGKLYKEALTVMANAKGRTHPSYAVILNDAALSYQKKGEYKKAEDAYKESLSITKAVYGNEHPEYATGLDNLATLYHDVANYAVAEQLYKEAIDIRKKSLGMLHTSYATALSNLAGLYADIANYIDAEPLYKESNDIIKKVQGAESMDYAIGISSLASMYQDKDDYAAAEPLLREAVNILRKMFGEEHPHYAKAVGNLGILLRKKKQYSTSENLLLQAITINKKIYGQKHEAYCHSLNAIAGLYADMNRNADAEKYYKEAVVLTEQVLGKNHPDYSNYLNNLVTFYYQSHNLTGWSNYFDESTNQWVKTTQQNILKFSEAEKEEYLYRYDYYLHTLNSMLYHNKTKKTGPFYYVTNCMQGWLLNSKKGMFNMAANSTNPLVKQTLLEWENCYAQYSKAIQLSIEQQIKADINTDSLFVQSMELEKKLIRLMPEMEKLIDATGSNVAVISSKLKEGEVLVHWVAFEYFSPQKWTDSTIYAAYIIKPNEKEATFVAVCERTQLIQLLQAYHGAKGRSTIKSDKVADTDIDKKLFNLLWKPLLPYLKNANTVYNIPAGQLNKVSFISLTDSTDGKALLEKYELHQLLSINELLQPEKASSSKTIKMFGGADYNKLVDTKTGVPNETIKVSPSYRSAEQGELSTTWGYLPGTKQEVNGIQQSIVSKEWEVTSFIGTEATEANFKKLSGSNAPRILHMSTHGFYFPPPKRNKEKESDNSGKDRPLLRSGIVLAGVNNYWGKNRILNDNEEDGIVTAQEIANMNFQKVELVVLSACQTALGDITNSEGVYGLQRAFKMAGAKKLLISLWEVPDAETAELMQLFYANLQKGETIFAALRHAQLAMKAKYKNTVKWAGFVLIGE
jgi:CHAT domain-containing protein